MGLLTTQQNIIENLQKEVRAMKTGIMHLKLPENKLPDLDREARYVNILSEIQACLENKIKKYYFL